MKYFCAALFALALLPSCRVVEKASVHGFESGYYRYVSDTAAVQQLYLDVTEEKITGYAKNAEQPMFQFNLSPSEMPCQDPVHFKKRSLDIDVTTVPFKYRFAMDSLPAQMNVTFNAGLYTGWRFDSYSVHPTTTPLRECHYEVTNRGFDFGVFGGIGNVTVNPFSTRNLIDQEYDGMILQYGVAGFLETNYVSLGLAAGMDYLLSPDRDAWIYNNKPWLGFIVGVALN